MFQIFNQTRLISSTSLGHCRSLQWGAHDQVCYNSYQLRYPRCDTKYRHVHQEGTDEVSFCYPLRLNCLARLIALIQNTISDYVGTLPVWNCVPAWVIAFREISSFGAGVWTKSSLQVHGFHVPFLTIFLFSSCQDGRRNIYISSHFSTNLANYCRLAGFPLAESSDRGIRMPAISCGVNG